MAVGSISTSSLRRVSARVVIQDEIDDFEVTPQGDSMALADMRAETFHNAVKLKSSTPTLTGLSRIEGLFEQSDKQRFFVPCQHCGHLQHLRWEQFKFTFRPDEHARLFKRTGDAGGVAPASEEIRDTANAVYVCEKCGAFWSDQDRIRAINDRRAEWQATAPFNGIRGRHLNGLYRVIGRKKAFKSYHHEFAEAFLKAHRGGREKMIVWVNTFLAETYSDPTKQLEWSPLMKRAEDYGGKLPQEVAMLVAAIDVQDDRIEIGIVGWGDEEECWWIENKTIYGDFDRPEVQQETAQYLGTTFEHPGGMRLPISATAIDSGHKTKAVYRFCRENAAKKVWAVKGSNQAQAALVTPGRKSHYGIYTFSVGTDTAKDAIFGRLEISEPGPRCVHFPKHFPESFYKQLCSEMIVETFERGVFKRKYVKKTARNEALDKFVYALAAYDILRPNIAAIRKNLGLSQPKEYKLQEAAKPPMVDTPKPQEVKPRLRPQRPWLNRGRWL